MDKSWEHIDTIYLLTVVIWHFRNV
jgi:hypothetical protein